MFAFNKFIKSKYFTNKNSNLIFYHAHYMVDGGRWWYTLCKVTNYLLLSKSAQLLKICVCIQTNKFC